MNSPKLKGFKFESGRAVFTLLTFIFLCAAVISGQTSKWVPTSGPGGVNVRAMVGDGSVLLAGTSNNPPDKGGLFRSTDNGKTWTAIKADLPVLALIRMGKFFFAGTSKGVIRSSDGGKTWGSANIGLRYTSVRALATNGSDLYVAIGSTLYRSTNGGTSWKESNLPKSSTLIGTLACSGQSLFVGLMGGGGGILRTSDGGQNWTTLNNGLTDKDIWTIMPVGQDLYVGTGSGIFHSTDGGQNWMATKGVLTSGIRALASSGADLYAGAFASGVYLSNDKGENWKKINDGLLNTQIWSMDVEVGTVFAGTAAGTVFRLEKKSPVLIKEPGVITRKNIN